MEQVLGSILESTIIGGAFMYMLHRFLNNFSNTLVRIADTQESTVGTLLKMDLRLELLEKRLSDLEGGDNRG